MAKRKNAVALFEVITATKRKEAAAAAERESRPRGAKWWFKGNSDATAPRERVSSSDVHDPTAGAVLPSPVYAPPQVYAAPQVYAPPQPSAPPAAVEEPPVAAAAPPPPAVVQRAIPTASYAPPAEPQPASIETPRADHPWRTLFGFGVKKIGLDPDRQEVTLRFRYTTAVVATFAVLVVVGLAYVTGRRSKTPPVAGPISPSSEEVRQGEVLAGVLELGGKTTLETPYVSPLAEADRTVRPPGAPVVPQPPGAPKPLADRVGRNVEVGLPRIKGLNYVIIQSYPKRADAEAAKAVLEAAGIPCTVDPVPPKWSANPNLWSVIGVHGFHRPKSTPEYKQYVNSILAVNKTFAGKSKYREFEPAPRKWQ